eukprot:2839695-Pyramimonas_sp.AAC.1
MSGCPYCSFRNVIGRITTAINVNTWARAHSRLQAQGSVAFQTGGGPGSVTTAMLSPSPFRRRLSFGRGCWSGGAPSPP